MSDFKYPLALFWSDFEATGIPPKDDPNNFSDVLILEVGVIITDFDLNPITGYEEVVKLTREAVESIKKSPVAMEMHKKNGLLKASRDATMSVPEVEQALIALIKEETSFVKGELMIAGSGVAAYDFPLIKTHMPELASYFAYYPFDIGVTRRTSQILAGKAVVNPTAASYGEQKLHRAFADVKGHLEEAGKFREFFRAAVAAGVGA